MWILVCRPKIYVYMSGNNLGWCILEMHSKKVIYITDQKMKTTCTTMILFTKLNLKISSFHILTSQKHISDILIFRNWFIVLPQLYFVVTALFFLSTLIFFLTAAFFHRFYFFCRDFIFTRGFSFFAALFCCHRFMFLLPLKWRRT